ncbi:DNA methyltransferase [bacterium]|nr:MAG: DNA methyltransferase [bacterium]
MTENLIEGYLTDMGEIRGTRANVAETSFYPALERLLSDIGKTLSPKVRCVINLANRGAGLPDGGLFSADQFRSKTRNEDAKENPFLVQNPSRGVIEAKPPAEDVRRVAGTEQVERYWKRYGMVLVTNFRAFAVIGRGPAGKPCELESFALAESENEFWQLTAHSRLAASEHGERMLEYLKRVLLLNAPLAAPQDVAGILASYAHDARLRIEKADLPALKTLRQALEDALGLRFEGDKGEHFFRSTLIQTLFYGVFSAWVLWARRRDAKPNEKSGFTDVLREAGEPYAVAGDFQWRLAPYLLRVPMLRALFVQVADPARLGALGLIEVLDWTAATLNRVDRAEFFKSFDEGHAVQYFYEPFLHAFDPELRKELGVWYTPEEIVRYQVERVDAVLRSELGLADGLADPKVVVLDPCCGTGTYLRAVLRRIAATLHDKGGDALVANDLKKAAMERVFGFEILPAPFVISHLQLGLELETLGAPLSDRSDPPERVGVYLTNALTGWELPKETQKKIVFPGFDDERDAAGKVKQEKPILVILGNPPYNAFAGVSPEEEHGLVEPYKKGLISEWGIKKFNLDDLYIRFFRLAEKRIAENGGRGVVSFISNHSWVSDPSFVVLRQHLLGSFDCFWIENMHGNRKISEYAPDGRTSETVFATSGFSVGIQQGVAVSLWVKHPERKGEPVVRFRDDINDAKAVERRAHLLASLEAKRFDAQYETSNPRKDNRWSFRPLDVSDRYMAWPKLIDLCRILPICGYKENRSFAMINDSRSVIVERMKMYFNRDVEWDALATLQTGLTVNVAGFDARNMRERAIHHDHFEECRVLRYSLHPFENKWCYFPRIPGLWNRNRPSLFAHHIPGNSYVVCRSVQVSDPEGTPFYYTSCLGDFHHVRGQAHHFPLHLNVGQDQRPSGDKNGELVLPGIDDRADRIIANLSPSARAYLASLGLPDPDTNQATAELIWYHALAIGYSPAYLTKNADGIRQDWPRIPLPKTKDSLIASAILGRQVAALLDTEAPVPGVTAGKIREELKIVAVFQRVDGKPAKPESGDLDLTAGWGHGGKGGVTMPGRGKLIRRDDGACDIYLNENTCWRNVPEAVWDYTIGGYQVIKKWLSYREKPLLGRGLTPDEVRYVTEIARRLAAIVALQASLDDNCRKVIKATYSWPKN